jgi:hypothetical protein
MRSIRTTSGVEVQLDGELLTVLETLFREVTARREIEQSYENMSREIAHLIAQMTDAECRAYLAESLWSNQLRYENDRLDSYMKKLGRK